MSSRIIRSHSPRLQQELADLMESLFVAELLDPSNHFWIVSPWVSDIVVINNRMGGYRGLEPAWEPRGIRLVEVLVELMRRGSDVTIGLRDNDHNTRFLDAAMQAAENAQVQDRISVGVQPELHEKGILGDRFYLSGSMNITHNGVYKLDEAVRIDTDATAIAEARVYFSEHWGQQMGGSR